MDLEGTEDPVERSSMEAQIREFGQAPIQLLRKPHPPKGRGKGTAREEGVSGGGLVLGTHQHPTVGAGNSEDIGEEVMYPPTLSITWNWSVRYGYGWWGPRECVRTKRVGQAFVGGGQVWLMGGLAGKMASSGPSGGWTSTVWILVQMEGDDSEEEKGRYSLGRLRIHRGKKEPKRDKRSQDTDLMLSMAW